MSGLKVLHLHSSFDPGGKELRCVQLMNAFGPDLHHSVVSAVAGAMGAAQRLQPGLHVDLAVDYPSLQGKPTPGRLMALAKAMAPYDLVLTYNFGAMDAVMAHTLFGDVLRLPPLVHHEDGFNQDEVEKRKPGRNWYRRIALGRAKALVVPSQRLEAIAVTEWHQPHGKLRRIVNGIDTGAYGRKPKADALPRLIKRPGEKWLGTLAGLRAVKNLPRLVRAFAALPDNWHLVILGEGPERDAIRAEAMAAKVGHRFHLPGHAADPARVVGLFDLFALSSDSEQFPISVVEAMAAGLAVAATDVGDVRAMVSLENQPFIVPASDEALGDALVRLAQDEALRNRIGAANRARARAEYDQATMVEAYRATYGSALGGMAFP
ncbi:glycosyltransferase [Novosphingobium sp.]|uniref:glycosyltransferase n=1 Tax=Novosphingobium sp. TaxID=1874826 RepID=UPI0031DDDBA4